jgi:hypothetical protein
VKKIRKTTPIFSPKGLNRANQKTRVKGKGLIMKDKNSLLSRKLLLILIGLALIIIIPAFASAQDVIISNSANWSDVYSTLLYANLLGKTGYFLTSTPHGPILLYEIPQDKEIQVITSADKPYVVGYEALIRSKGYPNPQELIFTNTNLELARRLTDINKFIIIDPSYGYNALAVAPYAVKARYYVLFAERRNIGDITNFLAGKNVQSIIIYGQVNREVRTALASYNPEVINSANGSRFENNMMIVDKYAEIGSIKQVILSNGEFIEASMMSGTEPVLFIGKNNVPDEIQQYIKDKKIEIGVLIGNELIGSATTIRRQLGISVFVKFARGSRIPGGTINPVEDLDRFPMPSYQLGMSIVSIIYNKATGEFEVTYRNDVNIATYFKSTITVKNANGDILVVIGDNDTVFIDGGETKTIVYTPKQPLTEDQMAGNITAEVYTIFGESKTSLENVLRGTFKIETINVMDSADINIVDPIYYDMSKGIFYVTIENIGPVDAYVSIELVDLWVNGEYVTVASDAVELIGVGNKKTIAIKIQLTQDDFTGGYNNQIKVRARYGERMHALIKVKEKTVGYEFRKGVTWWYIPIIIIVLILIIWFIIFWRRRKRCPRCRTMNKRSASHCKKCGHPFSERHAHQNNQNQNF